MWYRGLFRLHGRLGDWHDRRLSAVAKRKTMTPRDLLAHKNAAKHLPEVPVFKSQKRNKLPRPFAKLGGPRIFSTGMLKVSEDHRLLMYWRDGDLLTDRSFYGHLMCVLADGKLGSIFEFHWHPSHKGFHCKTPCQTESHYTERYLVQAPELSIKTHPETDPAKPLDLTKLVYIFCKSCGISLPKEDSNDVPKTMPLWPS